MIIICGKTIAEVERDLELAKMAIASGAPMGIGGATLADAEKAVEMLHSAVGGEVAITNPNYIGVPPHTCGCSCDYCDCNVCGGCEDEIYCPTATSRMMASTARTAVMTPTMRTSVAIATSAIVVAVATPTIARTRTVCLTRTLTVFSKPSVYRKHCTIW